MTGISAIYILDKKGKILITRAYRPDVPHNINEKFQQKMLEFDEFTMQPYFRFESYYFFFVKHKNLSFLAVTKRNSNAITIFAFLKKIIDVFKEYFNELEEESIRDNFVVIYELLDEMMDNGYPQVTETKILKDFVKTKHHQLNKDTKKVAEEKNQTDSQAYSSSITWRKPGIKYSKNEVYLDVIEKVNMVVSATGAPISSEIIGKLLMRVKLSGMPELKLGLNDKKFFEVSGRVTRRRLVDLEDIKFHQCVRLNKFENERQITFIPPDGEFDLMTYRVEGTSKAIFTVDMKTDKNQRRLDYNVRLKSNYKAKSVANEVEIYIPVPNDCQNPSFVTPLGQVSYAPDKDAILWTMKQFPGQKEVILKASLTLPIIESELREKYLKKPIEIKFHIPYYTLSGINVRYLKIEETGGYSANPWVRYMTENGDYFVRQNNQFFFYVCILNYFTKT